MEQKTTTSKAVCQKGYLGMNFRKKEKKQQPNIFDLRKKVLLVAMLIVTPTIKQIKIWVVEMKNYKSLIVTVLLICVSISFYRFKLVWLPSLIFFLP